MPRSGAAPPPKWAELPRLAVGPRTSMLDHKKPTGKHELCQHPSKGDPRLPFFPPGASEGDGLQIPSRDPTLKSSSRSSRETSSRSKGTLAATVALQSSSRVGRSLVDTFLGWEDSGMLGRGSGL